MDHYKKQARLPGADSLGKEQKALGNGQGLNPWEKRPSQISLPGISPLAKKRGAGSDKIPGKIPVKIPVLAPVFSLTHLHTFNC